MENKLPTGSLFYMDSHDLKSILFLYLYMLAYSYVWQSSVMVPMKKSDSSLEFWASTFTLFEAVFLVHHGAYPAILLGGSPLGILQYLSSILP